MEAFAAACDATKGGIYKAEAKSSNAQWSSIDRHRRAAGMSWADFGRLLIRMDGGDEGAQDLGLLRETAQQARRAAEIVSGLAATLESAAAKGTTGAG
ncbi:MAG: hypothetical protein AAGM22_21470 [Acidobacteriota bacterium]